MSIIGIVASQKNTKLIKKQLKLINSKIELISINPNSIENIKKVKFETIIIQEALEKFKDSQKYIIIELLKNVKYLLLNVDIVINEEALRNVEANILTYGLRQKSTITISSREDMRAIISIQRAFKNLTGTMVDQQEIPVKLAKRGTNDLYSTLIKIAIINIYSGKNR